MERLRLAKLRAQASPATPLSERLTLIDEQIARTRDVLNTTQMLPHHRASLLRSLDGLIERERVLRQGHAGPPRPERNGHGVAQVKEPATRSPSLAANTSSTVDQAPPASHLEQDHTAAGQPGTDQQQDLEPRQQAPID